MRETRYQIPKAGTLDSFNRIQLARELHHKTLPEEGRRQAIQYHLHRARVGNLYERVTAELPGHVDVVNFSLLLDPGVKPVLCCSHGILALYRVHDGHRKAAITALLRKEG